VARHTGIHAGMTALGHSVYNDESVAQGRFRLRTVCRHKPARLMPGHIINHEPLTMKVVTGTLFILSALIMHEFFDCLPALKPRRK
jgi:hypothetical protein